jgi:hypothetical protein
MGPQPLFLGDVLVLAEDLLDVPAERLALALPEPLLGLGPHVPVAGLGPDRVEEAALLWRRIIRDRWFDEDSRLIASACMRMVLDPEAGISWPNAVVIEVERVAKALEADDAIVPDLVDWVGSWFAEARRWTNLRPSEELVGQVPDFPEANI